MIKIKEAVIVEGKYDKIKLSGFIDGLILTTEGFGVFKDKEKQRLIRQLAKTRGLLVLTDSDGAGFVIRSFLKGIVPPDRIKHAYIPDIMGKEKRKSSPSREGKLGVEGISEEILSKAIAASGAHCELADGKAKSPKSITKADLYEYGLTGTERASQNRDMLKKMLDLPEKLSPNSLLAVLNCLMTRDEFIDLLEKKMGEEMK